MSEIYRLRKFSLNYLSQCHTGVITDLAYSSDERKFHTRNARNPRNHNHLPLERNHTYMSCC